MIIKTIIFLDKTSDAIINLDFIDQDINIGNESKVVLNLPNGKKINFDHFHPYLKRKLENEFEMIGGFYTDTNKESIY